jgi:hypothetical protein
LKRINPLCSVAGQLARPLPSIKSMGSFTPADTWCIPTVHDPKERAYDLWPVVPSFFDPATSRLLGCLSSCSSSCSSTRRPSGSRYQPPEAKKNIDVATEIYFVNVSQQ